MAIQIMGILFRCANVIKGVACVRRLNEKTCAGNCATGFKLGNNMAIRRCCNRVNRS